MTDILATPRHRRDRHNKGIITDRHRHSAETKFIALFRLVTSNQQWAIGPVDREIVPLSAEMDHPT